MTDYNWADYVSATGCTQYGPAGAQALMTYLEDWFPGQTSLGICNCRQVVGGGSYSHHAECRAYDQGVAISVVGSGIAVATLRLLGPHGRRLGIDHMIVNLDSMGAGRGNPRIYSATSPQGRVYTGTHPHKDHNHIGLTRAAGRNLTYGTLVTICGTPGGSVPGGSWKEHDVEALRLMVIEAGNKGWLPTQDAVNYWMEKAENPAHPEWKSDFEPAWSTWKANEGMAASRLPLRLGESSEDVRGLQDMLNEAFGAGLAVDGLYGPGTVAAVKKFTGAQTANPEGREGRWYGANQDNYLTSQLVLKKIPASTGVDQVARDAAKAAQSSATAAAAKASTAQTAATAAAGEAAKAHTRISGIKTTTTVPPKT
jgi:hypothetical protein